MKWEKTLEHIQGMSDEKVYFGMELVQLFTNLEGIKRDYE
jgi:hypothetical protein